MLLPDKLQLREATLEDALLLLNWRNEPEVRQMSFDSEYISLDKHLPWLERKLSDTQSRVYIISSPQAPIAQVRFDGNATDNTAVISIILDASIRGKGWATTIIRLALDAYQHLFPQRTIFAAIKSDNHASIRAFQKAGFKSEDTQDPLRFMHRPS